MSDNLDKAALAKRLAPKYVENYVDLARFCDEVIDPSGHLLGLIREEAAKLGLSPARERARRVIDKLLDDPEMWATHGCPPVDKLKRIEDELTIAFETRV